MQSQIIAVSKLFIGMDIHKKSWAVHLRTDLFDHKGFSMPPDPSNPMLAAVLSVTRFILCMNNYLLFDRYVKFSSNHEFFLWPKTSFA